MTRTISRRTVLRGLGVAMGLPWLDAMASRSARAGAVTNPPVRMACLFMPNGVNPHSWTPKATGKAFELTPILEPIAPHKDRILVLSNLMNRATDTGDGHYVKDAAWLTGTTIRRTTGADLNSNGISVDQLAAKAIGHFTPLPSLELGVEPVTTGVDVVVGYTRLYGSHISWSTPTTPVAKEINPKLAFDRLFRSDAGKKAGGDDDLSILDAVRDDAKTLRDRVGWDDRRRLDEYLDSVRAVEARIGFEASDRAAKYRDDPAARRDIETLGGRVDLYHRDPGRFREKQMDQTEHVDLMLRLIALAFQTDSTRVATFMFGNAVSNKNFSFLDGVKGAHHEMSHHENNADKLRQYQLINRWHVAQFTNLLDILASIKEGESTLLDNSMILFGSSLRDGNSHNPHDLPLVLAGGGGGTISTGRHLRYGRDTQLSNLYVSMLNRMGVATERFADSAGPLPGLDNADWTPAEKG